MKEQLKDTISILLERRKLYPVLTGILFLFNELRKNAVFYTLKENVSLILIVLAFTFLVDFLSRKFIKNKSKAALVAALFIFLNLFYQDIYSTLSIHTVTTGFINSFTSSHPGVITFMIMIVFCLSFIIFIQRTRRSLQGVNLYLNVILIAFIFLEIIQWAITTVPKIRLAENEPFLVNSNLLPEQKPDIYYIVLDSYTSSESLKKYWNFDNSKFEDSLKKLGFFVPIKNKSNYTSTFYCLASYLNSSLLMMDASKHYNDQNLLKLIYNNRFFDWLSTNKYECHNYSTFDTFGKKKYYNIFAYTHILGRTLWCQIFLKLFYNVSNIPQTNFKVLKKLKNLSEQNIDKPIFVYSHLVMPHEPFLFNENGNPFNESDSLPDKQKYLRQLIFTNSLTLDAITHILSYSQNKTIIVIQGDHGFRNLVDTTQIERSHEAHTTFYAIYSSNGIANLGALNPLNTFEKLTEIINK